MEDIVSRASEPASSCSAGLAAMELLGQFVATAITPDEAARLRERVAGFGAVLTTLGEQVEALDGEVAALKVQPAPRSSGLLYVWKGTEELRWTVLSIAAPVLIAALQDIGNVQDYRVWLFGIGTAIVRPLGGRLLALLAKRQLPTVGTPTPPAG